MALSSIFNSACKIDIGNNVWIGKGADIDASGGVDIRDGVIIAPEVVIYSRTHNFNSLDLKALPFDDINLTSPVVIKEYVWIGRRVVILPGVVIGKGAVIGSGAVISKNIPDYAIAVGNPAKIVGYRDEDVFENILLEREPFVYEKLGHKKKFMNK